MNTSRSCGLLSENKNEENTAEHLIMHKLTSGPIYTDVLHYTNIDRLNNRGEGWKRAALVRGAKRYYLYNIFRLFQF